MKKRYLGCTCWRYRLPNRGTGTVEIRITSGNRTDDEGQARYELRLKLKVDRLPPHTIITPDY